MNIGRRGFLTGAAKLIAGGMALALVPKSAEAVIEKVPLIWTPEHEGQETMWDGKTFSRIDAPIGMGNAGPLYLTVHRGDITNPTLSFAIAPNGALYWQALPGESILHGDGNELQEITITSLVKKV